MEVFPVQIVAKVSEAAGHQTIESTRNTGADEVNTHNGRDTECHANERHRGGPGRAPKKSQEC